MKLQVERSVGLEKLLCNLEMKVVTRSIERSPQEEGTFYTIMEPPYIRAPWGSLKMFQHTGTSSSLGTTLEDIATGGHFAYLREA